MRRLSLPDCSIIQDIRKANSFAEVRKRLSRASPRGPDETSTSDWVTGGVSWDQLIGKV
jgi:hypothetical protein